mmetsp:Transcript_33184/g.51871  ORF Transcript_33184/g.51871 Transcript_33184/m.51871 type:complete len:240 (-) Transcript_33184:58-777(-)
MFVFAHNSFFSLLALNDNRGNFRVEDSSSRGSFGIVLGPQSYFILLFSGKAVFLSQKLSSKAHNVRFSSCPLHRPIRGILDDLGSSMESMDNGILHGRILKSSSPSSIWKDVRGVRHTLNSSNHSTVNPASLDLKGGSNQGLHGRGANTVCCHRWNCLRDPSKERGNTSDVERFNIFHAAPDSNITKGGRVKVGNLGNSVFDGNSSKIMVLQLHQRATEGPNWGTGGTHDGDSSQSLHV